MLSWLILAWKEFFLPFHYRKSGCPGGRDFVWLTTFMALLLSLLLLLMASREGLLNRFVDVLLGNIPGHGVPISVTSNMLSPGGLDGINHSVLAEVRALGQKSDNTRSQIEGLTIYPHRSLEASLRPFISLPNEKIWQNGRGGIKIGPDFDGWAVYPDNPLWYLPESDNDFPLEIIVSRSLFLRYFDYAAYRNTLLPQLPEQFRNSLPEDFDRNAKAPFTILWLNVTLGLREELFPFRVAWIERFPVIDKIAYVVPLKTYHALQVAFDFPELRYFPEFFGGKGKRVKQFLIVNDSQNNALQDSAKALAQHLGADELRSYRGDFLVSFTNPVRQSWVKAYAEQYGLNYQFSETVAGDRLEHDREQIFLPCQRLPYEELKQHDCDKDAPTALPLDVTARGNGFRHALVYIPDRTQLSLAVNELKEVKDKALSIHPFYRDALNRFGFLSQMLEALGKPYTFFLFILLIAFLGIEIASLIGHHRQRYGVFLAKGMEWWQIYCMLWFQIFLAQISGVFVAWGSMYLARRFLLSVIQAVAIEYSETLSLADFNLLPLSFSDYFMAAAFILILSWTLATLFLYLMPLRRHTHPAALLH